MSLLLNTTKIVNEWTDYNNHMNLSFYILVFDKAAEKILSKFNMGEEAAIKTKRSTMVVETHTCLLYTSPSPRDGLLSRMPSSA